MDRLLRQRDLVTNPSARLPVCLCLDTSDSMNRVIGGDVQDTGRQEYRDGKTWTIVEGGIPAIQELNDGVQAFYSALSEDEIAADSAEVSIITFGGKVPEMVMEFGNIEHQERLQPLIAHGDTPMGEAVNLALDSLETRKQEYRDYGVDYYHPWLILMTDGCPNGDKQELERAVARVAEMVSKRKLIVFPIGVGPGADMDTLGRFASSALPPFRIEALEFRSFFQSLSQSVSHASQSMPGNEGIEDLCRELSERMKPLTSTDLT